MIILNDPVFGEIELAANRTHWRRSYSTSSFGEFVVEVERDQYDDSTPPLDSQRDAATILITDPKSLEFQCANALVAAAERSGVATTPAEIFSLARCRTILFPFEGAEMVVHFRVSWDEEHLFAVFFRENVVVAVE